MRPHVRLTILTSPTCYVCRALKDILSTRRPRNVDEIVEVDITSEEGRRLVERIERELGRQVRRTPTLVLEAGGRIKDVDSGCLTPELIEAWVANKVFSALG